jgi:hypothetical protein
VFSFEVSGSKLCLQFSFLPSFVPGERHFLSFGLHTFPLPVSITNTKNEYNNRRIVSSGLLRRVALVKIDVLEEPGASFIRVTKIGELGTTQAATSNRRTLRRNLKEAPGSSETSILTRATRRNNPEDTILHSHRRENLKSYRVQQQFLYVIRV